MKQTHIYQQSIGSTVAISLLLAISISFAQPPAVRWERNYTGGTDPYGLAATPDGGFIIAGVTNFPYDGYLLKIDSLGNFEWENSYAYEDDHVYELFFDVKSVPAGGYIAVGYRFGWPEHFDFATFIVRTNEFGDTLWTKEHNIDDNHDKLWSVVVTDNGDFICVGQAGYIGASSDSGDVLIMRVNDLGELLWQRRYGTPQADGAQSVAQFGDNRYIVAGNAGRLWEDDSMQVYVLLVDDLGDTLWTITYGVDQYNTGREVEAINSNEFWVTGKTQTVPQEGAEVYILKGDSLGNALFEQRLGHEDYLAGRALGKTPSGGCAIFCGTDRFAEIGIEYGLMRMSDEGDTLWTAMYGTNADDYLIEGVVTDDGGYLMCGINPGGIYVIRTEPETTPVTDPFQLIPESITLFTAYPNPFNSSTTFSYTLSQTSNIDFRLYDLMGREVQPLLRERQPAGEHAYMFDGTGLPSGIYFATLKINDQLATIKLNLVK